MSILTRRQHGLFTAAPLLVLVLALALGRPAAEYETLEVRGWTVHVERSLVGDTGLGEPALELLSVKLYDVARAVPEPALGKLREIPIWLSRDDPVTECACYHPSAEWLDENGHDSKKAGGVEIADAAKFLDWTAEQPSMVLHELAHGFHHQSLGYDHARLVAAHASALRSKRYDEVLHWDAERIRAYALNNPQEYFAELTEAWFGTNDFYPFVRAEVLEHDPEAAELLLRIWGG
jgi:hypothetical protein